LQGDRDAVLREAVDEVGGAVQGIDDPDVFVFIVQVVGSTGFLGQDGVVGVGVLSTSMMASSAALSTSVTKSLCDFFETFSSDTSKDARLMMVAARRAALIAVLSMGGMIIPMVPLKLRPPKTMAALLIVAMADQPAFRDKLAEQLARRNPAVKPVRR
jgi:hypothetical protein